MNPEIYMCYLLNAKYGNFKRLAIKLNTEFKTYKDIVVVRNISKKMSGVRKRHQNTTWNNFNVESLLEFINEYLCWKDNGK